MTFFSDHRLLPVDGGDPQQVFVFMEGHDSNGFSMNWIVQRWRGHFANALFVMPDLNLSRAADASALAQKANEFDAYLAALRTEFGFDNKHVVLVGHAEGASLAYYYGFRQPEVLCGIVGFCAELKGFSDPGNDVAGRPAVLLVHGELDDIVSPVTFLHDFHYLRNADVPAYTCFRLGMGREPDQFSVDSAMFFMQGAIAASDIPAPKRVKQTIDIEKSIKLVIWDLDETLWEGTLDDESSLQLKQFRVDTIRRLNQSGIVSAICSKNDFETARRKLEEFGLWDEFVFPRIAFVPKGNAIKQLIDDMQLKAKNCIFIDDNSLNLAEALAVQPDLHTLDATAEDCDIRLQKLVDAHSDVNKSRVDEYRSLQNRVSESQSFDGDRKDFLETCDIHVAFASSADLIDFAPRLEELINRTNQLNYLKTRVHPGSMVDFVSEPSLREGFALFAWDRFGYHGLVGFIAVNARTQELLHMAFSCRIMHMGMENALLERAMRRFPGLVMPESIAIPAEIPTWITEESFSDPDIRARIYAEERQIDEGTRDVRIRFMANCQSGALAHFSGLRDVAEIDSYPRMFTLSLVLYNILQTQSFAPALVYFPGSDYFNSMWHKDIQHLISEELYTNCANELCSFVQRNGKRLLIISTPSDLPERMFFPANGVTPERVKSFQNVWKRMADVYNCIDILDVDTFLDADRMVDVAHFRVDASREVARHIAEWFDSLPTAIFENDLALAG